MRFYQAQESKLKPSVLRVVHCSARLTQWLNGTARAGHLLPFATFPSSLLVFLFFLDACISIYLLQWLVPYLALPALEK